MSSGFIYTIKAHETRYKGVKFRSRLEARWAAFFDLVGWNWEYEPLDLNGWVPDFVLEGRFGDIFCEVKPISNMIYYLSSKEGKDLKNKIEKVFFETKNECLILGSKFYEDCWVDEDRVCIGALLEKVYSEEEIKAFEDVKEKKSLDLDISYFSEIRWDNAILGNWSNYGFCSCLGTWVCRITGDYEGNAADFLNMDRAKLLWNEAGNITRWEPRG